jgi:hypothetical protein
VRISKHFEDWDRYEEGQDQPSQYELKLPPESHEIEREKEREISNKKLEAELESMIPKSKAQAWGYPIDWDRLSKSVVL